MKAMLKKAPALWLALLLALFSASCTAPVAETEASANHPTESEAWEEHVNRILEDGNDIDIRPGEEVEELPMLDYFAGYPKLVFWEEYDGLIHASPGCMTVPDDTPFTGCFRGTLDEAKAAGHTEWCWKCSLLRGVREEVVDAIRDIQNDDEYLEKYGNYNLREDGNTAAGGLVEVGDKWYFIDP